MSTDVSNERASKNLVKGFVEKGQWNKVKKLANEGNAFAVTAIQQHEKDENKPKTPHVVKQTSSLYAAKQERKVSIDFTQLQGPAAAGKNGGGGQSLVVPPKPKGHGVKTNVGGGNGPKKTATTIVKNVSDNGSGKGKKGKKK